MTKQEKIEKKVERAKRRYIKNINRNVSKLIHKKQYGTGMDCPFDVEMYDRYGTCNCGGSNYSDCLGDI